MSDIIVSPSILSCDFNNLQSEVQSVGLYGAKWLHIDVMDGHFVPNITIGQPVVKCLRKITSLTLDCHLMIENPIKYINDFIQSGADVITFHYESSPDEVEKCIKLIKDGGKKVGISIKPKTPSSVILPYINEIDMVLIMTVEPGFSGQIFMPKCAAKIEEIKRASKKDILIQVDGGINDKTAKICKEYGARCFVAGNYIFKSDNRKEAIKKLLEL